MMRRIKNTISVLLVVTLFSVLSVSLTMAYPSEDENIEYCSFIQDNTRMSADGSFLFTVRWSIQSAQHFTANSNYIFFNTCANIWNAYNGSSYNDSSKYYRVRLYRVGGGQVGTYLGCANNVYGGVTFYNIVPGASYYFIIEGESALPDNCYFDGYGRVSPVTVQW